jgi:hypothetical protein
MISFTDWRVTDTLSPLKVDDFSLVAASISAESMDSWSVMPE